MAEGHGEARGRRKLTARSKPHRARSFSCLDNDCRNIVSIADETRKRYVQESEDSPMTCRPVRENVLTALRELSDGSCGLLLADSPYHSSELTRSKRKATPMRKHQQNGAAKHTNTPQRSARRAQLRAMDERGVAHARAQRLCPGAQRLEEPERHRRRPDRQLRVPQNRPADEDTVQTPSLTAFGWNASASHELRRTTSTARHPMGRSASPTSTAAPCRPPREGANT